MAELLLNVVDPNTYPTLASGITSGATSMTLSSASLLGVVAGTFSALLEKELLDCTYSGSGTTVTIARGRRGTTAAAHSAGAIVQVGILDSAAFAGILGNGFTVGVSADAASVALPASLRIGGANSDLVLDESGNSDGLSTILWFEAGGVSSGMQFDSATQLLIPFSPFLLPFVALATDTLGSTGTITPFPATSSIGFTGTLTGNLIVDAPNTSGGTSLQDGQTYTFAGRLSAAGTQTVTWNAAYATSTTTIEGQSVATLLTALFAAGNANKYFRIICTYDSVSGKYPITKIVFWS